MAGDTMTVQEASALLAMDERTVERMAEERQIPSVRVADGWVFSRKSLQKWQRLNGSSAGRA